MPVITIEVTDGDMGQDAAKYAKLKGVCTDEVTVGGNFNSNGDFVSVRLEWRTWWNYNWDFTIKRKGAKTAEYTYKNMDGLKKIEYALEKKAAQMRVESEVLPPPIITPPGPTSGPRVVAIYKEEGIPVQGIQWSSDTEVGVTDSLGQVIVQSLDPVKLVIRNHKIDSIQGYEQVIINVTNNDDD